MLGADAGALRGRRSVFARRGGPRVARGGRPRAAGAEQLRADHDPRGAAGRRRLRDPRDSAAVDGTPSFRGLRQAAPPRPPFQRKDRSQGAAARALRRLCDADQQIFDAAALIYQRRANECEAAAREYEHRRGAAARAPGPEPAARAPGASAEAATLLPPRSGGGPNDRRGRPP